MKFQLLIKTKILTNEEVSCLKYSDDVFILLINVLNVCWHFNIYEQDTFHIVKTKIPTNEEVSCFKSLRCCIYPANKCFKCLLAFKHL